MAATIDAGVACGRLCARGHDATLELEAAAMSSSSLPFTTRSQSVSESFRWSSIQKLCDQQNCQCFFFHFCKNLKATSMISCRITSLSSHSSWKGKAMREMHAVAHQQSRTEKGIWDHHITLAPQGKAASLASW
jgi:hypothetical protein